MAEEGLLVQSKHLFEININPGGVTPEWARLAKGFNSFEPSTNEEIDQTNYLDGEGFGTTTVMGAQLTLTFSGHRYYGDPAQDFIFSKAMEIDRKSTRLNSSHVKISYAVFCLKKKKKLTNIT